MNLRGFANRLTRVINPNEIVTVLRSTGFTVAASGGRQVPSYAPGVDVSANVQALDSKWLEQLDKISQQGDLRSLYLTGPLAGIVRPKQTGGDLVRRKDGSEWLVAAVLETWPDWTHAAIVRQQPAT